MSNCHDYCDSEYTCNCIHVYSDGTPIPGSGTEDDPYIHEEPIYKCIKLSNGTPLVPDATGCVTLPDFLQCLVDASGAPLPVDDDTGCVVVPSGVMSHLVVKDAYGNSRAFYGGDVLTVKQDGADQTIRNIETPLLVGGTLYFPQLKTRTYSTSEVALNRPGVTSIGQIDFSRVKSTNFVCNATITVSQTTAPILPTSSENLEFDIKLKKGSSIIPIGTSLIWEPNARSGFNQYKFAFPVTRSGSAVIGNDVWTLVADIGIDNLNASRQLSIINSNILISFI